MPRPTDANLLMEGLHAVGVGTTLDILEVTSRRRGGRILYRRAAALLSHAARIGVVTRRGRTCGQVVWSVRT